MFPGVNPRSLYINEFTSKLPLEKKEQRSSDPHYVHFLQEIIFNRVRAHILYARVD